MRVLGTRLHVIVVSRMLRSIRRRAERQRRWPLTRGGPPSRAQGDQMSKRSIAARATRRRPRCSRSEPSPPNQEAAKVGDYQGRAQVVPADQTYGVSVFDVAKARAARSSRPHRATSASTTPTTASATASTSPSPRRCRSRSPDRSASRITEKHRRSRTDVHPGQLEGPLDQASFVERHDHDQVRRLHRQQEVDGGNRHSG